MGSYVKSTVVTTSNPANDKQNKPLLPMSYSFTTTRSRMGRSMSPMGGADIAYMAGTTSPVYASRAQSVIPGTSFGNPDYRCSTVEISTSAPWSSHSGHYYPRTFRRVISISSLHSNDSVPLLLHGERAGSATLVDDRKFSFPSPSNLTRDSVRGSNASFSPYSAPSVGRYFTHWPSNTNRYGYSSSYQTHTPRRYSNFPKYQSRFLH